MKFLMASTPESMRHSPLAVACSGHSGSYPLPLKMTFWCSFSRSCAMAAGVSPASMQGLTLVHFSAQLQRFLWDQGCIWVLFRGV